MQLVSLFSLLFMLWLSPLPVPAQARMDSEFIWQGMDHPELVAESTIWYVKVEEDPKLEDFTKSDFTDLISILSTGLNWDREASGRLKLKLYFGLDGHLVLGNIGSNGMEINQGDFLSFQERLRNFALFQPGKQRGQPRNCMGILFLNVIKGKIVDYEHYNFEFSGG